MTTLANIPARIIVTLIRLYQRTLSPDHGWLKHQHPYGHCRFYPSCSEYARQSIERHGLIHGASLGLWRVLRCHPWSRGGVDPVRGGPTVEQCSSSFSASELNVQGPALLPVSNGTDSVAR